MFDEVWNPSKYRKARGDENAYHLGRIGYHHVVLAFLADQGTKESSSSSANFRMSFSQIRLALVVGICGGVPIIDGRKGPKTEVLLGDVVISTKVADYRFGAQRPEGFVEKDTLPEAGREIRAFLHQICSGYHYQQLQQGTSKHYLALLQAQPDRAWEYPGAHRDVLYKPNYRHKHHETDCQTCNHCTPLDDAACQEALDSSCEKLKCSNTVSRVRVEKLQQMFEEPRAPVQHPTPEIHIGVIGSGDLLMRSGVDRDRVVSRYTRENKIIAFEMEGAGVWVNLPTVIIKGVSDYADSHKRDDWQSYSAATAAACAKEFLNLWIPTDPERAQEVGIPGNLCK